MNEAATQAIIKYGAVVTVQAFSVMKITTPQTEAIQVIHSTTGFAI